MGLPRWLSGKGFAAKQKAGVWSLGQENSLEKEMATHSKILVWEIPSSEEPFGLQSLGSQRVRHDLGLNNNSPSECDLLMLEQRELNQNTRVRTRFWKWLDASEVKLPAWKLKSGSEKVMDGKSPSSKDRYKDTKLQLWSAELSLQGHHKIQICVHVIIFHYSSCSNIKS